MNYQSNPPGHIRLPPYGFAIYPEGANLRGSYKNNRTGIEIQTTYKLSGSNTLVAGGTYEEMKQFDTSDIRNHLFTPSPIFITLPSMRDLSHIQNINPSVKRNFKAFFVEDIWDITEDLRLTAGFRYDDYSDFGSHVSPRAGLT